MSILRSSLKMERSGVDVECMYWELGKSFVSSFFLLSAPDTGSGTGCGSTLSHCSRRQKRER